MCRVFDHTEECMGSTTTDFFHQSCKAPHQAGLVEILCTAVAKLPMPTPTPGVGCVVTRYDGGVPISAGNMCHRHANLKLERLIHGLRVPIAHLPIGVPTPSEKAGRCKGENMPRSTSNHLYFMEIIHSSRHARTMIALVSQLTIVSVAPSVQPTILTYRCSELSSATDANHGLVLQRFDHSGLVGARSANWRRASQSVAKLALLVLTPCPDLACGVQGCHMRPSARHLYDLDACKLLHNTRSEHPPSGCMTQLAFVTFAPSVNLTGRGHSCCAPRPCSNSMYLSVLEIRDLYRLLDIRAIDAELSVLPPAECVACHHDVQVQCGKPPSSASQQQN
mmetsp:Transcript_67169/g.143739  ORF Transcript_67169/g.143739 Transcript_67169/m.143739 type:complete len:336 (+) Transcript_67169:348-1355(+)